MSIMSRKWGYENGSNLSFNKNVLAEEALTNKLQHLNYEVFCSTSILNEIQMEGRVSNLVNHFPIIIIGETISSYEMELMLPKLRENGQKHTEKKLIIPSARRNVHC